MSLSRNKAFGLTKLINYACSSPQRAGKFSRYAQSISKTQSEYVVTNYLNRDNVEESIKVIERRWKPRGTRSFKQGILAYGVSSKEYSVEDLVKFNKELMMKTFPQFPWLVAVHINKPLLHAHFLLATTNVVTGKKLTQSPKDLQMFKDSYDALAKQYGLPLLKRNNSLIQEPTQDVPTVIRPDNFECNPTDFTYSWIQNVSGAMQQPDMSVASFPNDISTIEMWQPAIQMVNDFFRPITQQIQTVATQWYELGRQGGLLNVNKYI